MSANTTNPLEFFSMTVALGVGGQKIGQLVEKHVATTGKNNFIYRLLINAAVLYTMLLALPTLITSQFQDTLPGLVFCAAYFNSQSWA